LVRVLWLLIFWMVVEFRITYKKSTFQINQVS